MKAQQENMTLDRLPVGGSCIIEQVGNQRGAVKRRLIDMGLTPGTSVELIKTAPFGDPLEVRLRGYELSLRKEDAAQIRVRQTAVSAGAGQEAVSESAYHLGAACHGDCARCKMGCAGPGDLEAMHRAHRHEQQEHPSAYDPAAHDQRQWKVALVGNPNCGKTTLFNALTGSNQYVGNWPGVTVEKKEGEARLGDVRFTVVDLPGIYSLSPYSMEELVARRFIINEQPDAIIDIVDATNLERNLYLTMQLLELERPVVLAVNFMDEVEKKGDVIDCGRLSAHLGVPVVPISARDGVNIDKLVQEAHRQMHTGLTVEPDDLYDDFTHAIHHRVSALIHDRAYEKGIPAHWAAIKLLGGDEEVARDLELDKTVLGKIDAIAREYEASSPLGDRETLLADSRYRFVERVVRASVKKKDHKGEPTVTEKIDAVATHRIWAIPLFLGMMLSVFLLTFSGPGQWLSDGIAWFMEDVLCPGVSGWLDALRAPQWLNGLLVDGLIAGVGGVLTFLPMIALLFLFLSMLEDSGYMARAAFVMDRTLRRFGLSGKAFIPMLMGFGCTVPAVMGARTMENEKDRRMTILLVPFMSCGARLPVYGLMTAAFFPRYGGLIVFGLYVLGPLIAIISGLILKRSLFQGEPAPFLLELPPYRMPTLRNIWLHVWERVRDFLTRAGTVIAAMSIAIWFLQNFGLNLQMVEDTSSSILAVIGGFIAPVFAPMGFGVWQAAVALLTGLIAKEMVVGSMSLFYGFSLTDYAAAGTVMAATFTPAAALAFLVFCALYTPCVAAIATIRREMNSLSWTALTLVWQLGVAWLVSFAAYQAASLVM
ncbi:MAG: ferrous iron transport protein B [Oscillospiraceae bacterium]|nr:ferrous iron transport protein B [Oscillospiraceae bacterium]